MEDALNHVVNKTFQVVIARLLHEGEHEAAKIVSAMQIGFQKDTREGN